MEFINDLESVINGTGSKLIPKRKNKDWALFRVNAGAYAVANGFKKENRYVTCCVPWIDSCNDNKVIVQIMKYI